MKRGLWRLLTLAVLISIFRGGDVAWARSTSKMNNRDEPTGERWVIGLVDAADEAVAQNILRDHGLALVRHLAQIGVWVAVPTKPFQGAQAAELERDARIAWIEKEGVVRASEVVPNDPYYAVNQENLRVIGLPDAWLFTTGTGEWPIAVVDSGVDLDHPDLQPKIWENSDEIPGNELDDDGNGFIDDRSGWNFVGNNATPQDDYFHGSHVAGIAAAGSNNGVGVAGTAWGTPVMAVKVLGSTGSGSSVDVADGIIYAADNGARIINLSLGASQEFQVITNAVVYAKGKGCLVTAATGNTGGAVEYPAAQPEALAVAMTDNNDQVPWQSNRGPQVDLAAPGMSIFSANNSNFYVFNSGTSMATAHVSGVAALVWSLHPDWNAFQVSEALTSTAKDLWAPNRDDLTGWGRIDASAAVRGALEIQFFPLMVSSGACIDCLP